ncbi:hypothetical protein CRE_29308 [Caenorhabditis remanei]|uniref:Uncharacterized protein n=1 Tax=Caenorhabditis remanei TaxID=31234 RepID=E3MY16_CAERE|nr:hypothetical protein CRE_29308 [Caenorhabditis remanei]
MLSQLVIIYFLFVTCVFAGYTNSTTSPSIDINEELSKISATCLPNQCYEQLSGDQLTGWYGDWYNWKLLHNAQTAIGFQEMRKILGFPLSVELTTGCGPSSEDVDAAPTIEKYYELRESWKRVSYSLTEWFFEKQLLSGIEFMDKRVPAVRRIYRHKFKEIRRRPDAKLIVDRKEVDMMFEEYSSIQYDLYNAIQIFWENKKCRKVTEIDVVKGEKNNSGDKILNLDCI